MGEVYDLENTAKTKFPKSQLKLSDVLRRRDDSWRRMSAFYDRCDWVAKTLGAKLVDPSWIGNCDFKDGLH
jgi:hypothetical protein